MNGLALAFWILCLILNIYSYVNLDNEEWPMSRTKMQWFLTATIASSIYLIVKTLMRMV